MKTLLCLLGLFVLGGCSPYSTDFDCPKGGGHKCAPLHEVDEQMSGRKVVKGILPPSIQEYILTFSENQILYFPEGNKKIPLRGSS